jgi:hypothetical protein
MTDDNERVVSVADERTIPEITRAIEAAGGQVRHQLGRVLIVYAPAETRAQLTNLPAGTRLATAQEALSTVGDLDEAEQLAVRAMHLRQTPEYQEAKRNRPNRDEGSRTSTLLVIPLASKPSTMSLYHTTRKGHGYDSAPRLLPAGHCGMPVVMHHTSLYLAQQRRRSPSGAKRIRAPQVQTQTHERPQTV